MKKEENTTSTHHNSDVFTKVLLYSISFVCLIIFTKNVKLVFNYIKTDIISIIKFFLLMVKSKLLN